MALRLNCLTHISFALEARAIIVFHFSRVGQYVAVFCAIETVGCFGTTIETKMLFKSTLPLVFMAFVCITSGLRQYKYEPIETHPGDDHSSKLSIITVN